MESVEEDHGISLGREVAILPRGKQRFQAADDSRDRALREVPRAEQRFQRGPDAATIDAAEIAAEDRLVDLARPPRVPRQQLAVEFSRLAVTTSVAASVTDSMTVRVFMIESISASSGLHSSFARLVDFAATR